MSSIYKKGRDGYYYYQSYVFNSNTGKKDKRIFHALGTKDPDLAKKKQIELDVKYEKNNTNKLYRYTWLSKKVILLVFSGSIILILYFTPNQFKSNSLDKGKKSLVSKKQISLSDLIVEEKTIIEKTMNKEKEEIIKPLKNHLNQNIEIDSNVPQINKNKQIQPKIPEYKIQRTEQISGTFKQGKIFITVDRSTNKDGLLLLCQKIAKDFSKFSNIVICLYANTKNGEALAKGKELGISIDQQKKNWLALYTFNSVEGEFFDSNPAGYLGYY